MSLLLTLRNTTTGLSAEELVASVPGYGLADPSTNPLSARRKFERDKDTLRELGIDVTTTGRPEEPRYRVIEEDYTLPALHLSAEQAACLSLAASAWRDGDLPATARRALTKLRAVSEGPTGGSSAGLPVLTADLSGEEIPEELITAVDERRLVTFDYVSARSGSTRARTVEPHHLRLAGAHLDPVQGPAADLPAHLEGRDLIAVEYEDPFSFAGTVAALGDAVVVLAPESLRQAVLSHLQGAAGLAAPEGE